VIKCKSKINLTRYSALALLVSSSGITFAADEHQNGIANSSNSKAWISEKIAPSKVDIDLRALKSADQWKPGQAIKDMPRRRFNPNYVTPDSPRNPVVSKTDRLLSAQKVMTMSASKNTRAIEQQFDGSGYTGVNPPDTTGDVGINYYIQSINGSSGSIFTVYDKTTGALVSGPTNMETLGSGNCATGAGDPIVLFDEMANRWMLSEFSSFGNNLCVYISQTSDPISGGWFAYSFAAPSFPDYPKYGVGVDAYYVGTNETTSAVYALDRNAMLAGNAASMIRLSVADLAGFGFQMIQPADHDGVNDMPAGTPGYFLRHRDDEVHNASSNNPTEDYLELWEFNADFVDTNNASFTKVADIAIAEFDSDLCGLTSFSCFPQAGASSTLDPLREVVMFRAQYRNFDSYETLVGNFVTDVDGTDHGGIRWFELRRNSGGAWALEQEGTYSPDNKNRWMGSIAMDKDGNMALAYSWASSTDFPGIRYTGRLASDAAGVMTEAEAVLVAGTDGNSSNRWGDYSHLAVDPVDECTFWYTNQYGRQNGQWGTHISSFKFDSCGTGTGNQSPTAALTVDCTLLACSMDASASADSDGSIVSYEWDFGDGNTATGETTDYTYGADGTYVVTVTVTDDEGASGTASQTITISASNQLPSSSFSFVASELSVTFTDESSDVDGTVDQWSWDFGDGDTSNAQNPVHNYADEGDFQVTLTVTDNEGDSQTSTQTVSVSLANVAPISSFTYVTNLWEVTFSDGSSDSDGTVTSWDWDFGDGNSSSQQNPVHNYSANGDYTVTLTVTDDEGTSNASSQTVSVDDPNAPVSGGFTETNVSPANGEILEYTIDVPAGATVLDVDISGGTGNADLAINFGSTPSRTDNDCLQVGSGNTHSCSITNPSEGTWFIIVRGASASSGVQLDAYWTASPAGNQSPDADFTFTTDELELNVTDASSDSDGSIVSWSWDFGDGNSSSSQDATNVYQAAGTYSVSLTVVDDEGASDTTTQSVTVSESGGETSGGITETGISPARGENISFTVEVPAGADSFVVDTSGGTGNVDLVINFGSLPTRFNNDCIQQGAGNSHNCTITNPEAGTWFIIVRGAAASSDAQLDAYWFDNQ
jgi:PKD repeat protein